MKYWQLISIMRDRLAVIHQVAKRKAEWRFLVGWVDSHDEIVRTQDREKLDFVLDIGLVRRVLKKCPSRFFLSRDHHLRAKRRAWSDRSLSALKAFDLYGGDALEEALEYGSTRVASAGRAATPT